MAALSCWTTGSEPGKNDAGEVQGECRVGVEVVPLDQVADRADEDRLDAPAHVREFEAIGAGDGRRGCHEVGPRLYSPLRGGPHETATDGVWRVVGVSDDAFGVRQPGARGCTRARRSRDGRAGGAGGRRRRTAGPDADGRGRASSFCASSSMSSSGSRSKAIPPASSRSSSTAIRHNRAITWSSTSFRRE